MSASVYSLRANVLESLTRTKRPDVPLRVVVRNTLAVVLPLAIGMACGYTAVGLGIAAGALDTMFSDQPGPYRQRVRQLLLASLAAGLAAFAGFLIGGHLPAMLLATALVGFGGGMLVVFGTDLARVGMTSMILLVVTAAYPTSPGPAAAGAALIFAGGLLMMLFSVAAWPLQRYRPERQALAVVYRGLAAVARQRAQDDEDEPALSSAMTTLQQTLLGRYHARGRAMEAFGVMLELAERIRLELTALADASPASAVPLRFRARVARVLDYIAEALEEGATPVAAERALRALRSLERQAAETHAQRALHVHALAGQLAAAVRNANWAGSRGEQRAEAADLRLPASLRQSSTRAMLLANLTPHSVAFRHAVRSAVALSLALALSRALQLPHGYWLPMTVAIVLRPDFAATFNFGLLRVVGTVLGLLLTTALLHVIPDQPWAHLALMGVLCMAFRYLATAHYGIAVAALTGTVVVLLSFEGVAPGVAVTDRVINTALGSGMALLAYVLWPTWEHGRARAALADMLDAYADYLRALGRPQRRGAHRETRTAARTARTNALASLERMRAEPATPAALVDLAQALFANGNRLARTAMTLEALLQHRTSLPEQAEVSAFVDHTATALHGIAGALREQRAILELPDLRLLQRSLGALLAMSEDQAGADQVARLTDRLVDNVNTLAHVVGRCPQEPAAQSAGRHVHP
ncbi:MAG TPA: FUSC family protein [Frateuria sp.]|uniref:FUSC family protein n=1 Tax=Frateuria sp. TaxID=2211372 RepID=UPI002D7EEDA3|nr:FUSC family protein [Frateuria sp.]HET6805884.1 FUSC family protein [Frateuria sp.]